MDGTIVKNTELSDAITSQLAAAKASGNAAEVKRIEDPFIVEIGSNDGIFLKNFNIFPIHLLVRE